MPDPRLGELLGRGRTAEVYAWDDGQVLKLYDVEVEQTAVEREATSHQAARASGLPVPTPGDVVRIGDRLGLEMERIPGPSLDQLLRRTPWILLRAARLLARLHLQVHTRTGLAELPRLAALLNEKLATVPLAPGMRAAVEETLRFLPAGAELCHGDFHPGHVLLSPNGPVIIDWADASLGQSLADVARTTIVIAGAAATLPGLNRFQRLVLRCLLHLYEGRYFRAQPAGRLEHESWLSVMAAARLGDGIAGLEPWLRARLQKAFGA